MLPKLESTLVVFCLLLFTSAVTAQHVRGALEGRVIDPTGAVVTNAQIKVRNVTTNAEVNTVTNENGTFSFQSLEPGEYEVTVAGSGFRAFLARQVLVKVGSVTPLEVHLEIG